MSRYRSFDPEDRFPSTWPDAAADFLGAAVPNFRLIVKPTDATVLQVPAGPDNDMVAISIDGMWRFNSATVERASPGGTARTFDVYVTGSANAFTVSEDGETDNTDYSFNLAIVASGATPTGVALARKVATATWDGSKFTALDVLVGPQSGTARHASTHAVAGADPITPASIGAAAEADLLAETAARVADEPFLPSAGQKQALAGTYGTPSDSNRYVTQDDPELNAQRMPIAHAATHEPGGDDQIYGINDTQIAAPNKDGVPTKPSMRTLGPGSQQAMPGDYVSRSIARMYAAATGLSLPHGPIKIPFDTISYDPDGCIDLPHARYVCPGTGAYRVNAQVAWNGRGPGPVEGSLHILNIYKNGEAVEPTFRGWPWRPANGGDAGQINDIVLCNAGDYLEVWNSQAFVFGYSGLGSFMVVQRLY